MATTERSIEERIEWFFELSADHSKEFCSPDASLARERYLSEHTTQVTALMCMDGRIHLSYATRTPLGIIHPIRNLGGKFDLGWPFLNEVLYNEVYGAVRAGRRFLLLVTYHFSKGDKRRGCAGHNYDTEAAIDSAWAIKRQVEEAFGNDRQTVYPLVCGFETDDDALVFHGENGDLFDLGETRETDEAVLLHHIHTLYPGMPEQVAHDLLPLVVGNIGHEKELRETQCRLTTEHQEWVICVGRGFDFLNIPNLAVSIGPYSPDMERPISIAANIVRNNMASGRIPDDGFLLLASAPYNTPGVDRARAVLKARYMSQFAADVIGRDFPELVPLMHRRTTVVNWQTRALEEVDA